MRRRDSEGCDIVILWLVSTEMEEEKEMTEVDEIQKEETMRVATVCYSGWSPCTVHERTGHQTEYPLPRPLYHPAQDRDKQKIKQRTGKNF